MADVLTPAQRSFNMSRIRGKDTTPELTVRRMVHGMGFRYRLHVARLAGKPDLVFAGRRKVIFVHGCYWHMHSCRWGRVKPKTNAEFWQEKRRSNVRRDRRNLRELAAEGWVVLVVWECELREPDILARTLRRFLTRASGAGSRRGRHR
jgi:DNA mismatch endonuclease, patch repair protein